MRAIRTRALVVQLSKLRKGATAQIDRIKMMGVLPPQSLSGHWPVSSCHLSDLAEEASTLSSSSLCHAFALITDVGGAFVE